MASEAVAVDLVQYMVISVHETASLGSLVPPLRQLVDEDVLRILDLVILRKGSDGAVTVLEVEDVKDVAPFAGLDGEVGGLLNRHDIALAAAALPPGVVAALVVSEDRWATTLAASVRRVGGAIVGGERIPATRVEAALAQVTRGEQ